jgi:hypothetical protein
LFYSPLGHSPSNGGVKPHISLSEAPTETKALSLSSPVEDIAPLVTEKVLAELKEHELEFMEKVSQIKLEDKDQANTLPNILELAEQVSEVLTDG